MSDIYLSLTETPAVVTLSQPVISGALAATVTVGNTVTVALDANSLSALENVTVTVGAAVSVSNFPATQVVSVGNFPASQVVTGTVALDSASLIALENVTVTVGAAVTVAGFSTSSLPPSTVTVGNSVTIGNFPSTQTIAGTVTVSNATTSSAVFVKICGERYGAGPNEATEIQTDNGGFLHVRLTDPSYADAKAVIYDPVAGNAYVNVRQTSSVTIGSLPAISGTVTANVFGQNVNGGAPAAIPIASGSDSFAEDGARLGVQLLGRDGLEVGQGSSCILPIGGTVTANNPNGALTTRFGSVTTANTAQITSAVTNTNRKYLLAQNISAGTVTVGIGFSPTTTQGIQLTAGGGLTFDAFCPTGAVYWLGAVTGAAYTILEG